MIWATGSDILTPADQFIVTELCQLFEEKEFVRKALKSGAVPLAYMAPNGQINNHPFVKQLDDKRVRINSLISSIGFSPADRARLGVLDALSEDPEVKALTQRQQDRAEARKAQREANQ
jgi:P27 family predicted phage terminase small subunit